MNLKQNPTINELKKLINDCDDINFNHIIWASTDGQVQIEQFEESNPSYKFEQSFGESIQFWIGVFYKGKGYVGEDAANNDNYLEQLFNQLVDNWVKKVKGHLIN